MIERRPVQYKLGTEVAATVSDSSGDALVNKSSHGFSDGDVVYIIGEVESYNGYKFVDVISSSTFKIRNTENGTNIAFSKVAAVSYFPSILEHGWQSVHQPIVYQISNDKYPTNESYFQATILSVSDQNGYLKITCSGNIHSSTIYDLDYVKISNLGVCQIKDAVSGSIVVLDIAYDASYSYLVNETVTFHYNNFHIRVNIYAGLNASHPYAPVKPYRLLATLKLIPDENNFVTFDISEILRVEVPGNNNLLLDTLPLNLDAFTQFYIAFGECYDQSDGSSITVFEDDLETDTFEGYAIDAVMPFKSRGVSSLSDYIGTDTEAGRFLTLFERPLFTAGYYFDLSFIKNVDGDYAVQINGNDIYFADKGIGVYRLPLEGNLLYSEDELCVSIFRPAYTLPAQVGPTLAALSDFENFDTGSTDWTEGASPSINVTSAVYTNRLIGLLSNVSIGQSYTFNYAYTITVNSGTGMGNVFFKLWPNPITEISVQDQVAIQAGTQSYSGQITLMSPVQQPVYFGVIILSENSANLTIQITSLTIESSASGPTDQPLVLIADELCIDVIDAPCVIELGSEDFIGSDSLPGGSGGGCDCPPGILLE